MRLWLQIVKRFQLVKNILKNNLDEFSDLLMNTKLIRSDTNMGINNISSFQIFLHPSLSLLIKQNSTCSAMLTTRWQVSRSFCFCPSSSSQSPSLHPPIQSSVTVTTTVLETDQVITSSMSTNLCWKTVHWKLFQKFCPPWASLDCWILVVTSLWGYQAESSRVTGVWGDLTWPGIWSALSPGRALWVGCWGEKFKF